MTATATIRRLGEEPEPEAWVPGAIPWVHEAGLPYVDWLIGDSRSAREAIEEWMRRPSSEIYVGRATALVEGESQLGGFIAVPGAELASCRRADALALLGSATDRGALQARVRLASELFSEASPDQLYLSRLAVDPGRRGEGHGSRLVREYLALGAREGFRRFRLDVSADNEAAIDLYRAAGFELASEAPPSGAGIAYVAMELEL